MSNRTPARLLAVALLSGLAVFGAPALAGTAHAETKEQPPAQASGCSYAGQSYSEGSVRQQEIKQTNGPTYYRNYKCENGKWEDKGISRRATADNRRPAAGPGRVERG